MESRISATLSFGLVSVPVGVAPAITEKSEVSFRTLHQVCKHPVKMKTIANEAKKTEVSTPNTGNGSAVVWCETCNVEASDTIKGFEYAKDQFIFFTENEIESAKGGASKLIALSKFVKEYEVPQELMAKSYYLIPNPTMGEAYGLLYQALASTKAAGVGKQSLWGKEYPCVVSASQRGGAGVLMMTLMHCAEDLVEPDFSAPIPSAEGKKLAKELVLTNMGTIDPETDFASGARKRMSDMIAAKVAGADYEIVAEEAEIAATADVLETLKKSIEAGKKKTKA